MSSYHLTITYFNPSRLIKIIMICYISSYNGLGEHYISCPPIDWRNPNAVDVYNEIIKEVCEDFSVPFMDTRSVTGVMWERAEDWCHYRDISGEMEALYFLWKLNVFHNGTVPAIRI